MIFLLSTDTAMKQEQKYFSRTYREIDARKQRRKKAQITWRYCYCQWNNLSIGVVSPLYIHQGKQESSRVISFWG